MRSSKEKSPTPTDLIDWMNDEGLIELDWDFPVDGDLYEAGLDEAIEVDLIAALEEHYGVEFSPEDLKKGKGITPERLAKAIHSKLS